MSQVGRISGPLLEENLLRFGTDLAFETDLLYLDISHLIIGVNTSSPSSTLHINDDVRTTNLIVDDVTTIDNVIIGASDIAGSYSYFSTKVDALNVRSTGLNPVVYHNRMATSKLGFNSNYVESYDNESIRLVTDKTIDIYAVTTNVTGDVSVTGNITLDGNLRNDGVITIGDSRLDTVTIQTDFTQHLKPGITDTYTLGDDTHWWNTTTIIDDLTYPTIENVSNILISNNINIFNTTQIVTTQLNSSLLLAPSTGITTIENTTIQSNSITSTLNMTKQLNSTGTGYIVVAGNNGIVIPAGPSADRPSVPVVGTTRWNTTYQYLESFDGTDFIPSIGGGGTVTEEIMQNYAEIYAIILG